MGENVTTLKGKSPRLSEVEMTELVLPNDTNMIGNLLGGRLMHWIDIAAAMAASRHSNKIAVTRAVDFLDFRYPVKMGDIVILKAKLIWTGKTSMRILVTVFSEKLKTGELNLTNQAYLTFVALDEQGKPCIVPTLLPETEEEKQMFEQEVFRKKEKQTQKT